MTIPARFVHRRIPTVWVSMVVLVVLVTQGGGPFAGAGDTPPLATGVFSLNTGEQQVPADVLTHPHVQGVSLRQSWETLEPSEGDFDWSYLDTEIARVAAAGKLVLLRVVTGSAGMPAWVVNAAGPRFHFTDKNVYHETYNQQITIPVFWDPDFLSKKKRTIAALGARFNANPAVAYVATSCVNAVSEDWFLPDTVRDIANWKAAGWTTERVLDACRQIIDATAAAFPDKPMAMAVGNTSARLDPDATYLARAVAAYARSRYPGRFIVQRNSLSATVPDPLFTTPPKLWSLLVSSQPETAGQMVWYVTGDNTCRMNGGLAPCDPAAVLQEAITTGVHYGMRYLEIYQKDVRNPALANVIRKAADALSAPTPPKNLVGEAVAPTEIHLHWDPASDSVAVLGYHVYRGTTLIGLTYTNAFADSSVRPGRRYTYRVTAFDQSGNESLRSAPVRVVTPY